MNTKRFAGAMLALGLSVAALPASAGSAKPTYTGEVGAVLNQNCVSCHRTGQVGPMALTSYDEVRPWAKAIQKNVTEGKMPPWHASKEHGTFKNDRSLSEDEVKLIDTWVKAGAPQGDASKSVPMPEYPTAEWQMGTPDAIVTFDPVTVPGGGEDQFHDLRGQVDIPEDTWITAIEVLPGNNKVVHHVIIYQLSEAQGGSPGWLGAWAAGMEPMTFPEGTGRKLIKGAKLVGDMHYHPVDSEQTDQTKVGFYFAKENKVEKEMINLWVANQGFLIPPGDANYEVVSSYKFNDDAHIHGLLPHMHYRGKNFVYTAKYPDGKEETLLKVDKYDFNWQTNYELAEPKAMPKGTEIVCVAHFDNSEGNPVNPDPKRAVPFGNQSFDEMMIGFVDFTVDNGTSPVSAEELLGRLRVELPAKYPEIAYEVFFLEDEDDKDNQGENGPPQTSSVLLLPKQGDATWHLALMGMLREVNITSVVWTGDNWTGKATIPGLGQFKIDGALTAAGEVTGAISVGENVMAQFKGARFK